MNKQSLNKHRNKSKREETKDNFYIRSFKIKTNEIQQKRGNLLNLLWENENKINK